jgi:hypothetical protein
MKSINTNQANNLTRDHHGLFKFWNRKPEGFLRDEKGKHLKDEDGDGVKGTFDHVDISDLGLRTLDGTGEGELDLVIGATQYDIFRDAETHKVSNEFGGEITDANVLEAVSRYEEKFGVKERVNNRD